MQTSIAFSCQASREDSVVSRPIFFSRPSGNVGEFSLTIQIIVYTNLKITMVFNAKIIYLCMKRMLGEH